MSIEAMKKALEALESNQPVNYCENAYGERSPIFLNNPLRFEINAKAIAALRQAIADADKPSPESLFVFMLGNHEFLKLDEQGFHYKGDVVHDAGIAYRLFVEWMKESKQAALTGLAETSREIEDIPCKDHPDAPHGFLRDESHSSGRYVCECEAWEPDDMAHRSGGLSVNQEPVAWVANTEQELTPEFAFSWVKTSMHDTPLYTTPMSIKPENIDIKTERVDSVNIEPVAWMHVQGNYEEPSLYELDDEFLMRGWDQFPLYAAPHKPEWVGLSDTESEIYGNQFSGSRLVKAIEALLRERNT